MILYKNTCVLKHSCTCRWNNLPKNLRPYPLISIWHFIHLILISLKYIFLFPNNHLNLFVSEEPIATNKETFFLCLLLHFLGLQLYHISMQIFSDAKIFLMCKHALFWISSTIISAENSLNCSKSLQHCPAELYSHW